MTRLAATNAPVVAVQQLAALYETYALLDIPEACLDAARDALVKLVDELPINWQGLAKADGVTHFVLVLGEWWPVHKATMEADRDSPLYGFLRWELNVAGVSRKGIAKRHEWAKAAADGTVDYHWFNVA